MELKEYVGRMKDEFADCADFICREITLDSASAAVFTLRELSDKKYVADAVIKPLIQHGVFHGGEKLEGLLRTTKIRAAESFDDAVGSLFGGAAVIALEAGTLEVAVCSADSYVGRSISEPDSDVTVKGSKSGFVEDIEKNVALIRKIIRTPALKAVDFTKGSVTATRVTMLYVEGRADEKLVSEVRRRIENAQATVITDSGNLEILMKDRRWGMFPSTGSTEKADKAASLLVCGRVAVICDGSPFVLTAPYLFIESLQSAEDYTKSPYYATFVRILRFLSLLAALYLPALFYVTVERYHWLLPQGVYDVIESLRADIPISLFWELFIMLLVFEVLREVGLRMPRTVGDAVGIVGSIIIGDAATEAGIASTSVILIVALSAVSNFVVPAYMNQTVLLRFAFLLLGFFAGFSGIAAGTVVLFVFLFTKKSYGTYYMTPILPFSLRGMADFLIAIPQLTLGEKELDKRKSGRRF